MFSVVLDVLGIILLIFFNYNDYSALSGYNTIYLFPLVLLIYFISLYLSETGEKSKIRKRILKLILAHTLLFILSVFISKGLRRYIIVQIKNKSDLEKSISLIAKSNSNTFGLKIDGDVKILEHINYLKSKKSKTIVLDILDNRNYSLYLRTLNDGKTVDYHLESISIFPPKYRILNVGISNKSISVFNNGIDYTNYVYKKV